MFSYKIQLFFFSFSYANIKVYLFTPPVSVISPVHLYADWRVTQETVFKFVKQMSPKTCVLDPIPTSLFECSGEVFPL